MFGLHFNAYLAILYLNAFRKVRWNPIDIYPPSASRSFSSANLTIIEVEGCLDVVELNELGTIPSSLVYMFSYSKELSASCFISIWNQKVNVNIGIWVKGWGMHSKHQTLTFKWHLFNLTYTTPALFPIKSCTIDKQSIWKNVKEGK